MLFTKTAAMSVLPSTTDTATGTATRGRNSTSSILADNSATEAGQFEDGREGMLL